MVSPRFLPAHSRMMILGPTLPRKRAFFLRPRRSSCWSSSTDPWGSGGSDRPRCRPAQQMSDCMPFTYSRSEVEMLKPANHVTGPRCALDSATHRWGLRPQRWSCEWTSCAIIEVSRDSSPLRGMMHTHYYKRPSGPNRAYMLSIAAPVSSRFGLSGNSNRPSRLELPVSMAMPLLNRF